MRRPIFLGIDPALSVEDHSDAATLFARTGGNTGNLAFLNAVRSHLGGDVTALPLGASRRDIRAAGDVLVVPLANQLGAHTDLGDWANWFTDYGLPVIGIGLGAQALKQGEAIKLSDGTARWLATLARLSPGNGPTLGLRGAFTADQIARAGFPDIATVTGCPSNFTSVDNPADVLAEGYKRRPQRIAVNAGIPFLPALARVERMLVPLATGERDYIVQHGLEMIRIAYGEFDLISPGELELTHQYIMPDQDLDTFKSWCRTHAVALNSVQGWMDHVRQFDFVVGTRFHGAMLAIQAGVPAGCITIDSRTEEMCQTMGIPYCNYRKIDGLTRDTVLDFFPFDPDNYRETRRTLLDRYLKIYADADIAISDHLRAVSRAT